MIYSKEAIHCTSTCLDILDYPQFKTLSNSEIQSFEDDLSRMVFERTKRRNSKELANYMVFLLLEAKDSHHQSHQNILLESLETEIQRLDYM